MKILGAYPIDRFHPYSTSYIRYFKQSGIKLEILINLSCFVVCFGVSGCNKCPCHNNGFRGKALNWNEPTSALR